MLIKQSKNLAWRIIDGKTYIVNAKTSYLHSLDEVGTVIWRLIFKKAEFEELLNKLLAEYDADKNILRSDLIEFIEELRIKGLIEVFNAPGNI